MQALQLELFESFGVALEVAPTPVVKEINSIDDVVAALDKLPKELKALLKKTATATICWRAPDAASSEHGFLVKEVEIEACNETFEVKLKTPLLQPLGGRSKYPTMDGKYYRENCWNEFTVETKVLT